MGRSGGVGSNFEDGAVGSSGRSSRRRLGCMGYALLFVSYGIVDILLDVEHLLDDAPLRQHLQRVNTTVAYIHVQVLLGCTLQREGCWDVLCNAICHCSENTDMMYSFEESMVVRLH